MSSEESKALLLAIDNIIVQHLDDFKEQVNNRLDRIEEQTKVIPEMQNNIESMQSTIKLMQNDIKELQNNYKELNNKYKELNNKYKELNNKYKELNNKYKELYDEIRNISRTVAKIEVEHGEKLAILFDAVTGNIEKQEKLENRLDKCEKRIDNNDHQIYFLNSKIQNL